MNILVIGSGGREHALAWSLLRSQTVHQVYCLPGNGGTATLTNCQNIDISEEDFTAIGQFAQSHDIALVVVGPEAPLASGITDALQLFNIPVFGPTQAGAQLEASKTWAKTLMTEAGIPTAKAQTFTDADAAQAYIQAEGAPIVIKADGLAAGKGVTVALTLDEAFNAVNEAFSGKFGEAGQTVLIEEYLTGQEVSVLALADGKTIKPLVPAQDHKPIGEGDTGPNTGGMGAYAPVPWVTPKLMQRVETEILQPTLTALQHQGIDYRGVVYAGLIITPTGEPKVIEFNCRFGDPETQAVLSLLTTPLDQLLLACTQQRLAEIDIQWQSGFSACVVLASGGYPGSYQKGLPISGIAKAEAQRVTVFHAGTQLKNQAIVTSGGRVLAVTGQGSTFEEALKTVYQAIPSIQFEGCYYRQDIGQRTININLD
ncbi:phosphoribosylamine--glycine ligase [Acaryochloris sp. 'Moss Beach']|uniref:phosphoribosylamine--glycine ligase n=1 Tax=Acaryochloris sp. 'Moss Beach' TaxID=2740837 RepID=UPI001F455073|nr:phosphoribosylamine--glycine ligase [Acaryochloris sp. 'Moss Beach']UJB71042.1 phosphoribosylamine--glycine ligase [Acaryochloris sp. 'Moss Beach']